MIEKAYMLESVILIALRRLGMFKAIGWRLRRNCKDLALRLAVGPS